MQSDEQSQETEHKVPWIGRYFILGQLYDLVWECLAKQTQCADSDKWILKKTLFFFSFFPVFLFLIVVQVHLSPFSPHRSPTTPGIPTSHLRSYPPLVLSMCPLYRYCQFVIISVSLIIFCLLVCFVD